MGKKYSFLENLSRRHKLKQQQPDQLNDTARQLTIEEVFTKEQKLDRDPILPLENDQEDRLTPDSRKVPSILLRANVAKGVGKAESVQMAADLNDEHARTNDMLIPKEMYAPLNSFPKTLYPIHSPSKSLASSMTQESANLLYNFPNDTEINKDVSISTEICQMADDIYDVEIEDSKSYIILTEQIQLLIQQHQQNRSLKNQSRFEQIQGQFNGQIQVIEDELRQVRMQNSILSSDNRVLQQQLQEEKTRYADMSLKYTTEIEALKTRIEELQSINHAIQSETRRRSPDRRATIYYDDDGAEGVRVPDTLPPEYFQSIAVIQAYSSSSPQSPRIDMALPNDTTSNDAIPSPAHSTTYNCEPKKKTTDFGIFLKNALSNESHHEAGLDYRAHTDRDLETLDEMNLSRKRKPQKCKEIIDHNSDKLSTENISIEEKKKEKENPYERKAITRESPPRLSVSNKGVNQVYSDFAQPKSSSTYSDGEVAYKFQEVVRGQKERKKLKGYTCEHCIKFVDAVCNAPGGHVFNRDQMLTGCSRHRSRFTPPQTPDGFWDLTFRDEKES